MPPLIVVQRDRILFERSARTSGEITLRAAGAEALLRLRHAGWRIAVLCPESAAPEDGESMLHPRRLQAHLFEAGVEADLFVFAGDDPGTACAEAARRFGLRPESVVLLIDAAWRPAFARLPPETFVIDGRGPSPEAVMEGLLETS